MMSVPKIASELEQQQAWFDINYRHFTEMPISPSNDKQFLVLPNGKWGKRYILNKERLDDFQMWRTAELEKGLKSAFFSIAGLLIAFGLAFYLIGLLGTLLIIILFLVIIAKWEIKAQTKSFEAEFPDAEPTSLKVGCGPSYSWKQRLLIMGADPHETYGKSLFFILFGAYLLSLGIYGVLGGGDAIWGALLLITIGLFGSLRSTLKILTCFWFRQKYGCPLTPVNVKTLALNKPS